MQSGRSVFILFLIYLHIVLGLSELIYVNEADTWINASNRCQSQYSGHLKTFNVTKPGDRATVNDTIWNGRYEILSAWLTIEVNTSLPESDLQSACASARCIQSTNSYDIVPRPCDEALIGVCQNNQSYNGTDWHSTQETCVAQEDTYLIQFSSLGNCTEEYFTNDSFSIDLKRYHGNDTVHNSALRITITACTYITYNETDGVLIEQWSTNCSDESIRRPFFCEPGLTEANHTLSAESSTSTNPTVPMTSANPTRDEGNDKLGIIIGGVLAGVLLIVLCIIILFALCRQKREHNIQHKSSIQLKFDTRNSDIQRTLGIDIFNNRLSDTTKNRKSDDIFTVEGESGGNRNSENGNVSSNPAEM